MQIFMHKYAILSAFDIKKLPSHKNRRAIYL